VHGAYGQFHLLEGHGLGQIHICTGVDDLGKHFGPQAPRDNQHARLAALADDAQQLGASHPGSIRSST
jgi:hypothetical protein